VARPLFMYDCGAQVPLFALRCRVPSAELPIRLLLLNFRALGSTAKDVYIQQW
jgi:hypothetical protein